jgi:PIN domain nuclease of toxin-antitoxin system
MEAVVHLDTHVVVWLYSGSIDRFPQTVIDCLENADLVVSPMVSLELQYLHEIGRLKPTSATVLKDLERRVGLGVSSISFEKIVIAATALAWTRDPFDRLIVGNACADRASLVTADAVILKHYRRALWAEADE